MEEIDLRDLFDYFKGKISWIIIIVALIVAIGNLYSLFIKVPMYKSSTSLVFTVESGDNSGYTSSELQLNRNMVGTYSEIVKSKKVVNTVISNLDLNYSTSYVQSIVTVSSVSNAELIRISVVDPDNKLAAKIADELAYVFTNEVNSIYKLNNISVLDKAEISKVPYNINYLKDNLIYLMAGLVLSCGLIFIVFYFDTSIKTSEEIERKLGLTIIGVLPKVVKE